MLRVISKEQENFLDEEVRVMEVYEDVKHRKLIIGMVATICLVILFSNYISLYYTGVVSIFIFFGLAYVMLNPCYELPCKVIRRKTGHVTRFKKAMYVDVQTADGSVWTAKVSRRQYVLAKKGETGYIYFTDKDIEKNKPVTLSL